MLFVRWYWIRQLETQLQESEISDYWGKKFHERLKLVESQILRNKSVSILTPMTAPSHQLETHHEVIEGRMRMEKGRVVRMYHVKFQV